MLAFTKVACCNVGLRPVRCSKYAAISLMVMVYGALLDMHHAPHIADLLISCTTAMLRAGRAAALLTHQVGGWHQRCQLHTCPGWRW